MSIVSRAARFLASGSEAGVGGISVRVVLVGCVVRFGCVCCVALFDGAGCLAGVAVWCRLRARWRGASKLSVAADVFQRSLKRGFEDDSTVNSCYIL